MGSKDHYNDDFAGIQKPYRSGDPDGKDSQRVGWVGLVVALFFVSTDDRLMNAEEVMERGVCSK